MRSTTSRGERRCRSWGPVGPAELCQGSRGLQASDRARQTLRGAGRRLREWRYGLHPGSEVACPLLTQEARRYTELRRVTFVTPKKERGWDADPRARVFVVLGRYAKNGEACEREARALLASGSRRRGKHGPPGRFGAARRAEPFQGRGAPVRYVGELVERLSKGPKTPWRVSSRTRIGSRASAVPWSRPIRRRRSPASPWRPDCGSRRLCRVQRPPQLRPRRCGPEVRPAPLQPPV